MSEVFEKTIGKTKLYCSNSELWEPIIRAKHEIKLDEPDILEVDKGILLPLKHIPGTRAQFSDGLYEGGVCAADGEFVAGQRRSSDGEPANRSCLRAYEASDDIKYRDETVVFGGFLARHWGHALLDTTSRLWYAEEARRKGLTIVFVNIPGQVFRHFDLLALTGLEPGSYEIIEEPTQFANIIVPQESLFSLSFEFTEKWVDLFARMRANALVKAGHGEYPSKIFLSRAMLPKDNVVGEEYFDRYFITQGYEPVYLEQLPVWEQVAYLSYAQSVATTMGTLAHMAVFCEPGTELIILNRCRTIVGLQVAINEASSVNCVIVDAHRNFLPDRQTHDCPVLLAPGPSWNEFAEKRFGTLADSDYEDNQLPIYAFEYVQKWSKYFAKPEGLEKIRNFDLRKIVKNMNQSIHGVNLDTSGFPQPDSYTHLQTEVSRLRASVEMLESASPNNLVTSIELTRSVRVDALSWDDGVLALAGSIELIPEKEKTISDVRASLALYACGYVEELASVSLAEPLGGVVSWSVGVGKSQIAKALGFLVDGSNRVVEVALVLQAGDDKETVIINSTESLKVKKAFRGVNLPISKLRFVRSRWFADGSMQFDQVGFKDIMNFAKSKFSR